LIGMDQEGMLVHVMLRSLPRNVFQREITMNNHVKILMIALFALSAAACSEKEEPAAAMDDAVEEATEVVEGAGSGAMEEVASGAMEEAGSSALDEAGDLGDEAMNAAGTAMDGAEGQVGDIVDEAEDMAGEAMDDVMEDAEGMTEEELKEKAKEKLGLTD